LTWNQQFGEHTIKALIGTEAINNYARGFWGRRTNYYLTNPGNLTVDPDLWTLTFGPPPGQTTGNLNVNNETIIDRDNPSLPIQSALYSQFGRIDYNFADKYLFSATLRRDGSSVFAPDERWGLFPSVTAGWRISREKFFQPVTFVNDLKLRGGWGKLGSISNINPTNSYTLYNQLAASSYYDIGGNNNSSSLGIYNSQVGNVGTTWEEDMVTNIGFDASILNNRLDFSLEWYKKSISGLLFRADGATALTGGATLPFINSGNIQNTGVDASVTYHGKVNTDFNFDLTLTFTSYKNEVKSLPPGRAYYDRRSEGSQRFPAFSRMQPGQPLGAFFGLDMTGLWQSDEEIRAANEETRKATNGLDSVFQEAAAPGRMRFRDVNGDGKITVDDRTFFGNPNPDFTAGLNIAASYKNFDFSMFLYASVGNDVINYVRYWTDFPQVFDGAVSKDAVYNSWTPQRPNAKVPILERSANFSNTTQFNSYYLENGSFLKCKSMILGYNLPSTILSRFKIERLRLYVQASNLFMITKYTGLDPELTTSNLNDNSNFGIDFGNYPNNQRGYMAGVNLSF
jgi:TonB-linked SusC/RagA family outer membrane protein